MTSKPKTTVTFYNGLTTIGGPMIEVAYDKSITFNVCTISHCHIFIQRLSTLIILFSGDN